MPGEHLHAHFYGEGHEGLSDVRVKIIDNTDMIKSNLDMNKPNLRK